MLPEFGYDCDVICASAENAAEPADPSQLSLIPDGLHVRRIDTPFVFGRNPGVPPGGGVSQRLWWKARAYAEWLAIAHDWSWNWGVAAARALDAGPASEQNYDALVVDAPPRPAAVPLMRWARRRSIPVLLDLRDVWAWDDEARPALFDLRPASRRLRWELPLREEAIMGAAHVVLTTPTTAAFMSGEFPTLPTSHFSSIPNGFMQVDEVCDGSENEWSGTLRIAYTGSLAYGRIDQAVALVKGMAELRRRGGPMVELIIAGDEGETLLDTARAVGLEDHVEARGRISRDAAIQMQREADVLLLLQPSLLATREAIPAKLFEYMERRLHIFGLVGSSPGARIIEEHGLGVVSAEDPQSIAGALEKLAAAVAQRRFLPPPPEVYSERATVSEFAERLDRILARRRP